MTVPPSTLAATATALAAALALALPAAPAAAHGKAHQHGVAAMDAAVEGSTLTVELNTPLDNLLGFERAPRTDAERARVQAMAATLRAPQDLLRTDAAAGCTARSTTLVSPVLGLGDAPAGGAAPAAKGEHADLEASWVFECRSIAELRAVEVGLFGAFPGFKRIDVQVALPGRQARHTLTPQSRRLPLR